MGGIENFIERACEQVCVYWGSPENDGYGGRTFDDPVEVNCRWEDKKELFKDDEGNETLSNSVVYVNQDLDQEGYLYLGDFDDLIDLDSGDSADSSGTVATLSPLDIEGAYIIKKFNKLPGIKGTTFVRKIYLTDK